MSGTPPLPRYSHSSNISGPDIIFFGGWSFNSGERGEQNFIPQQDIDYFVVLNTENMCWEKGKFEGVPPINRYGHTASSIGPHVLIFGIIIFKNSRRLGIQQSHQRGRCAKRYERQRSGEKEMNFFIVL